MAIGMIFAAMAACCTGGAAILESVGARRVMAAAHVDPRLLLRLTRCAPYTAGIALDGASFGLTLTALRTLPLYAVQATTASSVALVATLATRLLRIRLRTREWLAVAAVVIGMVLVVISAHPGPSVRLGMAGDWWLLGAAVTLAMLAFVAGRWFRGAAPFGLLAGFTFGVTAVSARMIGSVPLRDELSLVGRPATYALCISGIVGALVYATALQRGSVTAASSPTLVGQTLAPAVIGWLVLGDALRPGFMAAAAVGLALTICGVAVLARHTHPGMGTPTRAAAETAVSPRSWRPGVPGGDRRSPRSTDPGRDVPATTWWDQPPDRAERARRVRRSDVTAGRPPGAAPTDS